MSNRLDREKATVELMIKLYCKGNHHPVDGLCAECRDLLNYASKRLTHCKFGELKPTCGKCTVHCYKPEMQQRIIEVMRYAGPRMLLNHPIIAIRHLIDGFKKSYHDSERK
ncbi:nitrous oxide-stimulated promoter family protein [Desulfosporosinus sp. BICA1-9]|uniref:nitrous oxide-stimulated promoter family protein n=1 Tax=Desulfosporosinus sp. BICA1-9 TaxID=1531958 RepID=UPI00054C1CA8|nr:nitrous oxide-stimulated promoter family protein [Desulfosporosinus sp. BICA1-9]HBW38845.1 nitrous oxide-stimulated promoter family protein [Desulfosporosinus sp.]